MASWRSDPCPTTSTCTSSDWEAKHEIFGPASNASPAANITVILCKFITNPHRQISGFGAALLQAGPQTLLRLPQSHFHRYMRPVWLVTTFLQPNGDAARFPDVLHARYVRL